MTDLTNNEKENRPDNMCLAKSRFSADRRYSTTKSKTSNHYKALELFREKETTIIENQSSEILNKI